MTLTDPGGTPKQTNLNVGWFTGGVETFCN